jgi:Spy/CpxP family protein refolding chaperone
MNRMLIALMLLGATPALAESPKPGASEQKFDERLDHVASGLGLDARATEELRTTFAKYREQLAPLRKDAWQTRRALKEEVASAQPDAARVTQLSDRLRSARLRLRALEEQRMDELKAKLTPEQYARLLIRRHARFGARRRMGAAGPAAPQAQ